MTAYISTDVRRRLCSDLLTFVAVFRDRPWFRHDIVVLVTPFLIILFMIVRLAVDHRNLVTKIGVNLLVLFVLALLCHGEVYRRRPSRGARAAPRHRREGETWHFFEIDPEVVRLARDPNIFRFLSGCAPPAPIVLGDARLTLGRPRR